MAEGLTMDRAREQPEPGWDDSRDGERQQHGDRGQKARGPAERAGAPARTVPARARFPAMSRPKAAAPARSRRRWLRPALFALLPLALVVGGYVYVTGGQVMSTDNAYVQADMVGVSTDVSGIVAGRSTVHDNQHVDAGQVLFRLDDRPFRIALERAKAQLGRRAQRPRGAEGDYRRRSGADRAGSRRTSTSITTNFDRQQQLRASHVTPRPPSTRRATISQTRRQKLASLGQQLAGVAGQAQRRSRCRRRAASPLSRGHGAASTRRSASSTHTVVGRRSPAS